MGFLQAQRLVWFGTIAEGDLFRADVNSTVTDGLGVFAPQADGESRLRGIVGAVEVCELLGRGVFAELVVAILAVSDDCLRLVGRGRQRERRGVLLE